MNKLKVIILAAGEGKRMKSKLPKVLHKVQGRTMLDHVIDAAEKSGAEDICVVIGHGADEVKAAVEGRNVKFAVQEKQLGTGHAVMQAGDFIEEDCDILVLYGDTPLITPETIGKLLDFHKAEENSISIISAIVENPAGYGHIIRNEKGEFLKNIEHKDADDKEKLVKEINTGIYCFKGKDLKESLSKINNNNAQGEYYLPDTLEILLKEGKGVDAVSVGDVTEFAGVNSRVQLAEAEKILKDRINNITDELAKATVRKLAETYINIVAESIQEIGLQQVRYNHRHIELILSFFHLLTEHIAISRSPSYYASLLHISPVYLNEIVKEVTGISTTSYIKNELILQAKRLLVHTDLAIKEISNRLGIDDYSYFSRIFTQTTGISPSMFRQKNLE